jgi:multidrug resistance efflux pump
MNDLPPIPTARHVRWAGFRTRFLPAGVFLAALAVTVLLWDEAASHRNAVGIAEGARSLVTTASGGFVEQVAVDPYQVVRAGDPVALVRPTDSRAQLDVLQMELNVALAELRPSLAEDHALDYERIRLELLRTQTDLAVARVNLRRAENEERRSRPLHEEKLVSEDVYDLFLQTRDMYQEQVNAHSNAVAEIELRLDALRYLGEPQTASAKTDALRERLMALRAEAAGNLAPMTIVAPIDGVVTVIHHQPGEHFIGGEPLVTISALRSDRIVGYQRQPYTMPLRAGQRVRVTTREAARRQFWSEISHVGAQVEIITNTLAVLRVGVLWDSGLPFVVRLPAGTNLRPGEVVDLSIQRADNTEPTLEASPVADRPPSAATNPPGDLIIYRGMADASAGVAITSEWMVVADDEESILRLYDRSQGGLPRAEWDLTSFLTFGRGGKEADIEGSARIGDTIYWVTSHGRNAEGKLQTSRHRFFATKLAVVDRQLHLTPQGRPYTSLLVDLINDPRLEPFALGQAAVLPPKAIGGLNLEALCPGPDESVILGFRNPIPGGKALLLPLLNPAEVVAGQRAILGEPRLLDLGGYGIRSLDRFQNRYFILAGSWKGGGKPMLYVWEGTERPPIPVAVQALRSLNPEAITVFETAGTPWLHALSDDGTRLVDGIEAKRLADSILKTFRGVSFPLPLPAAASGDALTLRPVALSRNRAMDR